ncbi:MAG: transposase family protein [Leptospira sp.]|nr:transposase family protein [Leptospira sp.]
MKVLDKSIMERLLFAYENSANSKKAKGAIIREFESLFNSNKSTFYRALKKYNKNRSILTACNIKREKKSRLSPERRAKRKQELIELQSSKEHFRGMGTEMTAKIIMPERFTEIRNLSVSQINRDLRTLGISSPLMKQRKPSTKWEVEFSNQLWMADASPMEAIFLNLNEKLEYDRNINLLDKHVNETLQKKKLRKVWVYYIVDVFSRAYLAFPVADLPSGENSKYLGENSIGWRKTFGFAFLPKGDFRIPIEGIPDGMYSDRGSGLIANDTKNFLLRLNPKMWIETHFPGHPWAKGIVEGRIGGFKRTIEKLFTRELVTSFPALQQRMSEFVAWDNERKGYFRKWLEGTKEHPVKKVTPKEIDDSNVTLIERKVDTYRSVSIEGTKYFICDDVPEGVTVSIYRRGDQMLAQLPDGTISYLDPAGPVSHGVGFKSNDGRGIPLSERLHNVEDVKKRSRTVGSDFTFDNLRPSSMPNVGFMPARGERVQTHSPMPPEKFASAKEALVYFTNETGIDRENS